MNQKQATLISFLQEAGASNNNYWSNQNSGENETYGTNCIKPTKPTPLIGVQNTGHSS